MAESAEPQISVCVSEELPPVQRTFAAVLMSLHPGKHLALARVIHRLFGGDLDQL
jgi:hypothetical protein